MSIKSIIASLCFFAIFSLEICLPNAHAGIGSDIEQVIALLTKIEASVRTTKACQCVCVVSDNELQKKVAALTEQLRDCRASK